MSQTWGTLGSDSSMASYKDVINNNFATLRSSFAGDSSPNTGKVAGQLWYDSSNNVLKLSKNTTVDSWVTVAEAVTGGYLPLSGGTMTGNLNLGAYDLIFANSCFIDQASSDLRLFGSYGAGGDIILECGNRINIRDRDASSAVTAYFDTASGAFVAGYGTESAPGLGFGIEGFYRNGADDIRYSSAAAWLQKWTSSVIETSVPFKVPAGVYSNLPIRLGNDTVGLYGFSNTHLTMQANSARLAISDSTDSLYPFGSLKWLGYDDATDRGWAGLYLKQQNVHPHVDQSAFGVLYIYSDDHLYLKFDIAGTEHYLDLGDIAAATTTAPTGPACPRVDAFVNGEWIEVGRAIKHCDDKFGAWTIELPELLTTFRLVEDEPEYSYIDSIRSEDGTLLIGDIETTPAPEGWLGKTEGLYVIEFESKTPTRRLLTTGFYRRAATKK